MKKLLALTLTVIMALSLFVMPAYAETELPAFTDVYAGQQTITFKLAQTSDATELTAEQAALVKITRMDTGAEIGFTNKITGDILTIMANDGFVINDADSGEKVSYLLEIGNIKKTFSVNKIWEDKLDTAASTATADTGLKNSSAAKAVVDGKLIYDCVASNMSNGTGVYPDEATYINKENVSFSTKVQFLNKFPSYNLAFNMSTEFTQPYNSSWNSYIGFGFHTYYGQSGSVWYDKYTHTSKPVYNYNADGINVKTFLPAYTGDASTSVLNYMPLIELSDEVGTTPSKNKWTDSSYVVTSEMKDKNIFKFTIDKMGSVATLVQEGKLAPELSDGEEKSYTAYKEKISSINVTKDIVNIYDTADDFVNVSELNGKTAPTTGRFGVLTYGGNTVMAFYDMVLTETEISDYDDTLNITDNIYAGQDTITVKLSAEETITELRPEQAARIKLTRADTGEVVPFSNKISGDILTIMPEESFVINEADAQTKVSYILDLGDVKKIFTVNKLWEDKLDTAASTATADTGLSNSAALSTSVVADGKLIIKKPGANGTAVYPDLTGYETKENLSFSAKIQYLNKCPSYAMLFNMNSKFTQPYNSGWNSYIGFALHTYFGYTGSSYAWADQYLDINEPLYNYNDGTTNSEIMANYTSAAPIAADCRPLVELSADVSATPSLNPWIDSNNVVIDEMKDKNITKLTIDKMGDIATLVQDAKLHDTSITETRNLIRIWDTKETFAANSTLASKEVPTNGYFGLATVGNNSVVAFYDMVLTETEIRDYEVGSFNVTDIFADKDKMTVTFDSNIEKADLSKVIVTQANGNAVECSKTVTDNELIITPNGGFVLDRVYNITLTDKFGYEGVLISSEYSKDFRINKIKEITFDDGETYAENGIDIKSYGGTPAATIRNGKLYVQDAYYSTIYLRNVVDKVENYRVNFTMQRYAGSWYNRTNFMFNADKGTTLNYGNNTLTAFGWIMREDNSTVYRDYRHSQHKTGADAYRTEVVNDFKLKASATDVTFTENSEKGDYDVALPSTDAPVHNFQLDKTGTKGALTIDGTLIDTFETKDVFKEWNENQTDESKKLESEIVPSKGDLLIAGYNTSGAAVGTIAIGTITFTSFEIIEDVIEITNVTYLDANGNTLDSIKNATAVKGTASVKNYFGIEKPMKLVAIAYAGDEMLDVSILDASTVAANGNASADYSFTGLTGLTEIKVVVWEAFTNLYPYCAAYTKY